MRHSAVSRYHRSFGRMSAEFNVRRLLEFCAMQIENSSAEVFAEKDENNERPIPSAWRSVFREIINAFVHHDYLLSSGIPGVAGVSDSTATQIKNYIDEYGETLTELPEETWDSSICIWTGDRWDALVDLWTISEGRSDLVLSAHVTESKTGFVFHIYMVYVP